MILFILLISVIFEFVVSVHSENTHFFTQRLISKGSSKFILNSLLPEGNIIFKKYSRGINHLGNLPIDLIHHLSEFADRQDVANLKLALPTVELGRTPDQALLLRYLRNTRKVDMKIFLELSRKVDPLFANDYLLRFACAKGMFNVVKYLVKRCKADIHSLGNWPYAVALENGHGKVYQFLQSIDRVGIQDIH